MQKLLFSIFAVVALILGVSPIIITAKGGLSIAFALSFLNCTGWLIVAWAFVSRVIIHSELEKALKEIHSSELKGNLLTKFTRFLRETTRYYRASHELQINDNTRELDVGVNLQKVLHYTYQELNAQAVQILLFDDSSGSSSRLMSLGMPSLASSQDILEGVNRERNLASITRGPNGNIILRQPLRFARTTFGILCVELGNGVELDSSDIQTLFLLATQASLMLIDAEFSTELLRMKKLSEESVRAKTGFLANLSHEIRGPLGIILNGVELIIDGLCGPVTEMQSETLKMVKGNSEHLLDLVNDVLDYAKVEAGKVNAKPVEIQLHELLDDLTGIVRSQAIEKKHKLVLKPVDQTLGMSCDKRHSRQMLINLLTNAIKYTPEGGEITVWAEKDGDNKVKVLIKDTGVGIPKDQAQKVFSAFERVEDQYSKAQTGTGLGMPLTKRLAQVNGGDVDFVSEAGKGSTFWLSMPFVEIKAKEQQSDAESGEQKVEPQGNGEEILIVDYDPAAREMLGKYLGHQGFKIIHATNGSEVLSILKQNNIQLAVVENDMPDSSGEDMISAIRGTPKAAAVPIILLSSRAFVFDIERFLKLGVDRCLSKPVSLNEIAQTARRLIDETKIV